MLACLQRQNQQNQRQMPPCAALVQDPTPRPHSEPVSTRGPSLAELDAFAHRTSLRPLSIRIFPASVRVPQHKQLSRTVNGLDTRIEPGSQPRHSAHQGLLAIATNPAAKPYAKGLLKSYDGKRTRLSPIQMAVAPYAAPIHRPQYWRVPSLQHVSRPPSLHCSPSVPVATAASCDPGLGLPFSGAVLPMQSADVAGAETWPRQEQQRHPQAILHDYSSPNVYRSQPASAAATGMLEVASSPAVCGDFSVGHFYAPTWTGALVTPLDPREGPAAGPPLHPQGLSSSLRSLESLVSDIRPPCIKERMLGQGFQAIPQPPTLR